MLDRGSADLLHHCVSLGAQKLEHALDAGLAEGAEAPDIGPADADLRRGAEAGPRNSASILLNGGVLVTTDGWITKIAVRLDRELAAEGEAKTE
jgi:hypothetical protein